MHIGKQFAALALTGSQVMIAALALLDQPRAQAQAVTSTAGSTPPAVAGGSPAGSYTLSGLDTVDLYSGTLSFTVPLLHVGGRGEAGYTVLLSPGRRWDAEYQSSTNTVVPYDHFWYAQLPDYAPGLLVNREEGTQPIDCPQQPGQVTFPHYQVTVTRLTFVAADGTETEFRDEAYNGQPQTNSCSGTGPSRGNLFASDDGSAATFVSDDTIYDTPLEASSIDSQTYPSGYLYWRNGVRYRISNGLVTSIRDRNGNLITINYDQLVPNVCHVISIVDSLNRQITISYIRVGTPYQDNLTFKGFGGAQRTLTVYRDLLSNRLRSGYVRENYNQLFPELSGSPASPYDRNDMPSVVQLPDGRQYQFLYDSYGEIARVVLPTGGALEYDFTPAGTNGSNVIGTSPSQLIYRRLQERRVYPDGSTLEQRTDYTPAYAGTSAADFQTTVTENSLDSSGNLLARAIHVFYGNPFLNQTSFYQSLGFFSWKEGRETQTQYYDVGGNRLLRTLNDAIAQRAPVSWWTDSPDLAPPNDPQLLAEYTMLETNQVSERSYAYDQFNNRTDVWEYDYGQSGAGALLRHTHTNFLTSNLGVDYTSPAGPHLRSLPLQEFVYQVSPGSANESLTSQTLYTYDVDATTDRPGIVNVDPAFTSGYRPRGNVSSVARWLNQTNAYVTNSYEYDVAGNVTSATDPNGNVTGYDYSDRFGSPDGDASSNNAPPELEGGSAFAFQTLTRNPLGETTLSQYDFYIGQVVDAQDENGTVTSRYYNDALDRVTQIIAAANRSVRSQTSVAYEDSVHMTVTTADQYSYGDNVMRRELLYDGLGRTVETHLYEAPGAPIITSKVRFDGLGRINSQYNPFRPSDPQYATVTAYDGLSRPTSITATDGSVTSIAYVGNAKTTTDPAGKSKTLITDGLNRLVQVTEDPASAAYVTFYNYDALDDLTQVNQGNLQRLFVYDSLKRLTSANEPESGTTTYAYDGNNNLVQRTDGRLIQTAYAYDALNRITQRSYSDQTPMVTYAYDNSSVAFATGHLTAVTSSVSTYRISQYDPFGRILGSSQATGGQTYSFGYSYNLAGALTSETYPSGRTITTIYDAANRAASVNGSYGATPLLYAGSIQYAAHGPETFIQLGNNLVEQRTFNNRLEPTQISLGAFQSPTTLFGLNFSFTLNGTNNNGNVYSQVISAPGMTTPLSQSYLYDNLNRLGQASETSAMGLSWSQTYDYDRNGNRAVDPVSTYVPLPSLTPQSLAAYDSTRNRWNHAVYDGAGNITSDLLRVFTYDADDHQTSIAVPGIGTTTYVYEGLGHRVQKIAGANAITYVYDAFSHLTAEYSANAATTAATNFLTADHLGSIRVVTDKSGNVVSRHDYLPFGEEIDSTLSARNQITGYGSSDGVDQRFTGKERDAESGLDNFLARYLSGPEGRFTSPDRAHGEQNNPQSFNKYSYAFNTPASLVDLDGLSPVQPRGPASSVEIRGPAVQIRGPQPNNAIRGPDPQSQKSRVTASSQHSKSPASTSSVEVNTHVAAEGLSAGLHSAVTEPTEDFLQGVYKGASTAFDLYGNSLPEIEGGIKAGIASNLAGTQLYISAGKGFISGIALHYILDYVYGEKGKVPVSDVPGWSDIPFVGNFFDAAPSAGERIDNHGACTVNGVSCGTLP